MWVTLLILIATSRDTRAADDIGDTLDTVVGAEWNSALEEWKQTQPAASCRTHPGDSYESRADEMYCQLCSVESERARTEWFFYAFGDEEPPRCRLYQIRRVFRASGFPGLGEALSKRLGPATQVEPLALRPLGLAEFGSGYWKELCAGKPEGSRCSHSATTGPGIRASWYKPAVSR